MVKTFNFFKRKPGLSVDDFRNYWLNEHAAIIRAIPEMRKYVASITLPSAYRNREPLYDGISEAWFDDEARDSRDRRLIAATRRAHRRRKVRRYVESRLDHRRRDHPEGRNPRRRRGEDVLAADSQARYRRGDRSKHTGERITDRWPRKSRKHAATCNATCGRPDTPTEVRRVTTESRSCGSTISMRSETPATPMSIAP